MVPPLSPFRRAGRIIKQVKTPFTVEDVARGNDYCRLAVAVIPRLRNGRSTGICGGCYKASPCRDRVVPRSSRTLSVRPWRLRSVETLKTVRSVFSSAGKTHDLASTPMRNSRHIVPGFCLEGERWCAMRQTRISYERWSHRIRTAGDAL